MARGRKIDVRVVVEGGGDAARQDGPFREGYGAFLRKLVPGEIDGRPVALEIVRGKGRTAAGDKFASLRTLYPDALLVLLIDSEEPVPEDAPVWPFLLRRDGIKKPNWATEDHAYLMVQRVETWLIADPSALRAHYGKKLDEGPLPHRINLEEESEVDVQRKLERATGTYRHGDSAALIARVESSALRGLSRLRRLESGLVEAIRAFARN